MSTKMFIHFFYYILSFYFSIFQKLCENKELMEPYEKLVEQRLLYCHYTDIFE